MALTRPDVVRISSDRIVTRKRRILAYVVHYAIRIPHLAWQVVTLGWWRTKPFPKEVRKVLIIRPDGIGDLVMTLPGISALQDLYPHAEFTLLAGSPSRSLLPHLRCTDHVSFLDLPWAQRSVARLNWPELRRVLREIRQEHFDLIVDLRGDFRNIVLMQFMGGGYKVGFGASGGGFLLDREIAWGEKRHDVEHKLDVARALGGDVKDARFELVLFDEDREAVDRLLSDEGVGENGILVIHPGAQWPGRQWTASGYAQIADRIIRAFGLAVVVTGVAREEELCREVITRMQEEPVDLVNRLTFGEFLAILSRARLFFGVDSGPMHLAMALGVPTVALFGAGDPDVIGPHGSASHIVVSNGKNFACSPCAQTECPLRGRSCMDAISMEEAWGATEELIGQACQTDPRSATKGRNRAAES